MIGPLAQFTGRWRLRWLRLSFSFAGVFTAKVNSLILCVGEHHPTKSPTLLWRVVVLVVFFKWFDTCKTHFTCGTSRSHKGKRRLLGVILVLLVSAFIYFFHHNWARWRGQFLDWGLPNFLHFSFIWLAQKIGAACPFKADGASLSGELSILWPIRSWLSSVRLIDFLNACGFSCWKVFSAC